MVSSRDVTVERDVEAPTRSSCPAARSAAAQPPRRPVVTVNLDVDPVSTRVVIAQPEMYNVDDDELAGAVPEGLQVAGAVPVGRVAVRETRG